MKNLFYYTVQINCEISTQFVSAVCEILFKQIIIQKLAHIYNCNNNT